MDRRGNVIDFCHECKFAWPDGCPRGQWPCITCFQNWLWEGYKTDYMVKHFVKKEEGNDSNDYSFYWRGN